jgi:oligopeptidase A
MATTTPATAAANPLLQQEDLPKFKSIEPKHLTPAVEELLAKMEADLADLERRLEAETKKSEGAGVGYDRVLPEVERIQFALSYAWGVAGHLNGVRNGDELRAAYEENQPRIVQAMSKFQQSRPLYDALSAIEKRWGGPSSSSEEGGDDEFEVSQRKRAVEQSLRSMTLGGVGLEGEAKDRFNEIKMRLAQLSTTFSNNVLDETKAYGLTIEDPDVVKGVPGSAKAMWAQSHLSHLKAAGAAKEDVPDLDPERGPWRITLDAPSYVAVLSHLPDRAVREQVYRASVQRASDLSQDEAKSNVGIIYEILQLKAEMASMLGFQNYAELSLASKMAPSVQAVSDLTDLIAAKALPAAEKELAEITAFARANGGEACSEANLPKLQPWDITFWSERLKESKFELTEEETRPYFALPAVLEGMFSLVERLFNIQVRAADGETDVWHEDVRFFKVYDADSGRHVASFFLDPYSRPEDKRGGAWMDTCVGKSSAVNRDIPVAYLTCNGSPPVGDKPSLMTFREVETLFHEFGHGLQHMLTTASVGDVAGINGVEWDAVELPSQFMENWCVVAERPARLAARRGAARRDQRNVSQKVFLTPRRLDASQVLRPPHRVRVCQALGDGRANAGGHVRETQGPEDVQFRDDDVPPAVLWPDGHGAALELRRGEGRQGRGRVHLRRAAAHCRQVHSLQHAAPRGSVPLHLLAHLRRGLRLGLLQLQVGGGHECGRVRGV